MTIQMSWPPAPRPFGLIAGRYAIHSVLGSGGGSVVYRGIDRVLDRPVAVKVLRRQEDRGDEAPADLDEARLSASLDHPGVVRTLDAGCIAASDGYRARYVVLELVDGSDLREVLRRGALPSTTTLAIGAAVASALAHVHHRGVVHNDIKPSNVLVPRATPRRARLTDFGIAFRTDAPTPSAGVSTMGTAAYLSPERVSGATIGDASDIYALGLVLLECLTRRVAFPGPAAASALARLERAPDVPTTVPEEIAALIREMTAMRPDARPAAATVIPRLERIAASTPGRHAALR